MYNIIVHSPLEQFEINTILALSIGWVDLSFTNSSLSTLISVIITSIIAICSVYKSKIIPTRWQSVIEMLYLFVYNIMSEQIGTKGKKYFPIIFTIFLFVLVNNILGMIPYNFTSTSHIVTTYGLSLSIFLAATIIGFRLHGWYFLSLFVPSGIPMFLAPLIVIIEVVSYLSRSISLGVRLAVNMFAGHTLLKIMATFSMQLFGLGGLLTIAGLVPLTLLFALSGLEILIAFLQAYVFTVLTSSYLGDSINLH